MTPTLISCETQLKPDARVALGISTPLGHCATGIGYVRFDALCTPVSKGSFSKATAVHWCVLDLTLLIYFSLKEVAYNIPC